MASSSSAAAPQPTFETQRAALLAEIELSLEQVLANINKLNRNLESLIAVGNEFSSVEALWSQFENVMAKDPEAEGGDQRGADADTDDAQRRLELESDAREGDMAEESGKR